MSAPQSAKLSRAAQLSDAWPALLAAHERSLVSCLASRVVHDLNNALSGMQTNTFLLKEGASPDGSELLAEIDAAIDESAGLTQQLRQLILDPPAGPSVRSVADLLGAAGELLQQLPASTPRPQIEGPADAADAWVDPLVSERVVSALLVLLGAVTPAGAELLIRGICGPERGRSADVGGPSARHLSLTLRVACPTSIDSQMGARHGELIQAPVARLASALARLVGGDVQLAPARPDCVQFNVKLPLLSVEEVRASRSRWVNTRGGLDVGR